MRPVWNIICTFAPKQKKKGTTMARQRKQRSTVTDNPKLKWKKLSDGSLSAYLEYYLGFEFYLDENGNKKLDRNGKPLVKPKRKKKFLHLSIPAKPSNPIERNQRNETMIVAEDRRREAEKEFREKKDGYKFPKEKQDFFDFYDAYIKEYTKKDKRMIIAAEKRFKEFLLSKPKYKLYADGIIGDMIDKKMIKEFADYLQERSKGSGAQTVFQRFKKVMKAAVEQDVISKNPCTGISIPVDETALVKDVLTSDEIMTLINTHYMNESKELRRAFIFTLYTGIRYCDLVDLTYKNVDYPSRLLRFDQNKTKHSSPHSHVDFPLNDFTLALIGDAPDGDLSAHIFTLPSHESCNKSLKRWCKHAGITKHITWHCGRHSFATNVLYTGTDIKTVASLLGHSGLKYTERYVRAIDERKKRAVDALPTPQLPIPKEDSQQ